MYTWTVLVPHIGAMLLDTLDVTCTFEQSVFNKIHTIHILQTHMKPKGTLCSRSMPRICTEFRSREICKGEGLVCAARAANLNRFSRLLYTNC